MQAVACVMLLFGDLWAKKEHGIVCPIIFQLRDYIKREGKKNSF